MTSSAYFDLQELICVEALNAKDDNLLPYLKGLYQEKMNASTKYLEKIPSLGRLIGALEYHGLLSEDNLEPMKVIASRLPNKDELLDKITNFETIRQKYIEEADAMLRHDVSDDNDEDEEEEE